MDSLRNIPGAWPDGVSAKGKFTRETPGHEYLSEASIWNLAPKREKRLKDIVMPVYIKPTNSGICGILSTGHYTIWGLAEVQTKLCMVCLILGQMCQLLICSVSTSNAKGWISRLFFLSSLHFLAPWNDTGNKPHHDVLSLSHSTSS